MELKLNPIVIKKISTAAGEATLKRIDNVFYIDVVNADAQKAEERRLAAAVKSLTLVK